MIPGLPAANSAAVLALLKEQQGIDQVLLYGSRAMGRHHSGSDVDLCLVAPTLQLDSLAVGCTPRRSAVALDALAARVSCEDGVAVEVVSMGDDTDADFPAIYGDLFEQQTFDPANGGWRYDVQPSYDLPDFSDG